MPLTSCMFVPSNKVYMKTPRLYPALPALVCALLLLCFSATAQVGVQNDVTNVLQNNCSDYIDVTANDQLGGSTFTLSVVSAPQNGTAAVSGSDSSFISYCPNAGFTGTDQLQYNLRIGGQNYTATLYINVLNPNNTINAGDADQNGRVENYDVLTIGLAYNLVGPGRGTQFSSASLAWQPSAYVSSDPGAADCNGDGIVDSLDASLLETVYGNSFAVENPYTVPTSPCRNGIPLFIQSTNGDSIYDGDTLDLLIKLGQDQSLNDAYGVAFTLELDNAFADADAVTFETDQSWLLQNNTGLFFKRSFRTDGKIEMAVTRTNHNTATGGGTLLRARVPIDDNIDGIVSAPGWHALQFSLTNVRLVSEYNVLLDVCTKQPQLNVYKIPTGINGPGTTQLKLYPNPSGGIFFIEAEKIEAVELTDLTGRLVYNITGNNLNRVSINTGQAALAAGCYLVKVRTANFTATQKIFVQH